MSDGDVSAFDQLCDALTHARTADSLHAAESQLLTLRANPKSLSLSLSVISKSHNPWAVFHAAGLARHVAMTSLTSSSSSSGKSLPHSNGSGNSGDSDNTNGADFIGSLPVSISSVIGSGNGDSHGNGLEALERVDPDAVCDVAVGRAISLVAGHLGSVSGNAAAPRNDELIRAEVVAVRALLQLVSVLIRITWVNKRKGIALLTKCVSLIDDAQNANVASVNGEEAGNGGNHGQAQAAAGVRSGRNAVYATCLGRVFRDVNAAASARISLWLGKSVIDEMSRPPWHASDLTFDEWETAKNEFSLEALPALAGKALAALHGSAPSFAGPRAEDSLSLILAAVDWDFDDDPFQTVGEGSAFRPPVPRHGSSSERASSPWISLLYGSGLIPSLAAVIAARGSAGAHNASTAAQAIARVAGLAGQMLALDVPHPNGSSAKGSAMFLSEILPAGSQVAAAAVAMTEQIFQKHQAASSGGSASAGSGGAVDALDLEEADGGWTMLAARTIARVCHRHSLTALLGAEGHGEFFTSLAQVCARAISLSTVGGQANAVGDDATADDHGVRGAARVALSSFNSLLTSTGFDPSAAGMFAEITGPLSELYVTTELGRIEAAFRASRFDEDFEDAEEGDEAEEDAMAAAASLARLNPARSCAAIASKMAAAESAMRGAIAAGGAPADGTLVLAFECAEWLVRFAGHVLADAHHGEVPMIPTPIAACAEPAAALINACFSLSQAEDACLAARNPDIVSPAVAEAISWFLARWQGTYLLPDMSMYTPRQPPAFGGAGAQSSLSSNASAAAAAVGSKFPVALAQACTSQGGVQALSYIVTKIHTNLTAWAHDPAVTLATSRLALAVAKRYASSSTSSSSSSSPESSLSPTMANALSADATWPKISAFLLDSLSANGTAIASGKASRVLSEAASRGPPPLNSSSSTSSSSKSSPSSGQKRASSRFAAISIADHVGSSLASIVDDSAFASHHAHDFVVDRVRLHIESLRGVARAALPGTFNDISRAFIPLLSRLARTVVPAYSQAARGEVVLDVVKLFRDVISAVIAFVGDSTAEALYGECLALLESYSQMHATGKARTVFSAASSREESEAAYKGIKALVKLIDAAGSRGNDLFSAGSDSRRNAVMMETVLRGLTIVFPLITAHILEYPSASRAFFSLVASTVRDHPNELARGIPREVFAMLNETLSLGTAAQDSQVCHICLEAISIMASNHIKLGSAYEPLGSASCFSALCSTVVTHIARGTLGGRGRDAVDAAAEAIFALTCAYPTFLEECLARICAAQPDHAVRARVARAAGWVFACGASAEMSRENREKFARGVRAFAREVSAVSKDMV